jgi:hypothetical protein
MSGSRCARIFAAFTVLALGALADGGGGQLARAGGLGAGGGLLRAAGRQEERHGDEHAELQHDRSS